jgi:hypothetical protein
LPEPQTVPHAPQLFASLSSLVQVPPQTDCPDAHCVALQSPFTQNPLAQDKPVTHTEPTGFGTQAAAAQASPGMQALPQAPQEPASVCRLVQTPLQVVCPAAQALQTPLTQNPLWQLAPDVQAVPVASSGHAPPMQA